MRRTARALSVALVAGAALALGGTAASADPAADTGTGTGSATAGCASISGPCPSGTTASRLPVAPTTAPTPTPHHCPRGLSAEPALQLAPSPRPPL